MTEAIISFDIGGTKIKSGLVLKSGEVIDQSTASSRASDGPEAIMSVAQSLSSALLSQNEDITIGAGAVSTGGVVDNDKGIIRTAFDFMPGWGGFEIKKAFEKMVSQPVLIDNDGNCALFAEIDKQELNDQDVAMLVLGTGLGGALYLDGNVRGGASALAGHFGQTLIGGFSTTDEWEQLETFLSGSGLGNIARRIVKENDGSCDPEILFPDGQAVVNALSDSEIANTALTHWVSLLARTCHNIQWNYDPDIILIGGGMIEAKARWWPQFEQALADVNQRFRLPGSMDVRPASLNNNAAMVGAALMAWAQLEAQENAS